MVHLAKNGKRDVYMMRCDPEELLMIKMREGLLAFHAGATLPRLLCSSFRGYRLVSFSSTLEKSTTGELVALI